MVAATALWGATFVVVRDSVRALDPAALVLVRFTAAAVVLGVVAGVRRAPFGPAVWIGGAIAGVLAAGGYGFQALGLTTIPAGSSAFLTCVGSLFSALFAWPLLGQRPSATLLIGVGTAVAGSALLVAGASADFGRGEAWTLLGAALFALQVVTLARFAPGADPVALTAVQAAATALTLCPLTPQALKQVAGLSSGDGWRLAYLIGAGSTLAPLLQVAAQRTLPAGRIGLLLALEPVFALAFALSLGHERFMARWWVGATLILCGVAWVEYRAARVGSGASRRSM